MRLEDEKISEISNVPMRVPSELKEILKMYAKRNKQSLNAEIVHRLQRTVEEDENSDMLPLQEQIDYLDSRINELDAKIRELQGYY
jgi:hypothetical protein